MSDVVFDFTRIHSAFQQRKSADRFRPHLFLWDLSRLIESLILYDRIITTEATDYIFNQWKSSQIGPFNLSHDIYDEVFSHICECEQTQADLALASIDLRMEDSRVEYRGTGLHFYRADVMVLPQVMGQVRMPDFQFLGNDLAGVRESDETRVLTTMERVRVLLALGSQIRAPYDPVFFRQPIVRLLSPGNVESIGLQPYRQFENDVYEYISHIIGRSPSLNLPLMFHIVLRETRDGSPDDIFRVTMQLRSDPKIRLLREAFGRFVSAYGDIDLPAMAQTSRILENEISRLKKSLAGELTSNMNLRLKPGLLPLDLSLEIKEIVHRLRDRNMYPALSNLATLTRQTFAPMVDVRSKIKNVLNTEVSNDDLVALSP